MRDFEEICREYDRRPEQVEASLYALLRKKSSGEVVVITDHASYGDYLSYLYGNKYLAKGTNVLTQKGERAINRGWIVLNIKRYKREKRIKIAYRILNILFAAIAAIASIFAAYASYIGLFL